MALPAGGAGFEEPLADIVVSKGALRLIPYTTIDDAVKAGKKIGIGATGAMFIKVRGQPMIYKYGRPGNVANEYIAYQLFAAMGARVPASYLVVNVPAGGIPMAVLTEYLRDGVTVADAFRNGLPTNDASNKGARRKMSKAEKAHLLYSIQSEFLYHALLLNWDAKNWENHMIVPRADGDGYDLDHPFVLDPGGALFYRAMGAPKFRGDLLATDIPEFIQMPIRSADTRGKFYVELFDKYMIHGTVCRKAATVDDATVLRVVEEMRPLFGYLPKDADLPGLIAGRLAFLRDYCAGKIDLSSLRNTAKNAEHFGLHVPPTVEGPENYETSLARQRYAAKVSALTEEATSGLRMRGKREVVIPPPLNIEEDFERFRVYNRPVVHERRHAGVNKYGFEYDSDTNDETSVDDLEYDERSGIYPKPYFTMKLDRSADAQRVRHAVLGSREDPAIDDWLRKQTAYIRGLSTRDYHILTSYTRNGDVLVNNYLRGTLRSDTTDLIYASLAVNDTNPNRPVALAYSIYDQFPELIRGGKLNTDELLFERIERKEDLLDTDGELDMAVIRGLIDQNIDYFGNAVNLGPLIEQYRRDLVSILERAPRAPHAFTVFRGIQSESYTSQFEFQNRDFLSTSISPEWAVRLFTKEIKDVTGMVARSYRCCLYELDVRPDVPCIYMQSISQFPDEYEVLIAPGMSVSLEPTVYLKIMIDQTSGVLEMRELWKLLRPDSRRNTKVAVVEGEVRLPATTAKKVTTAAVINNSEYGVFEDKYGKYEKEKAAERFAASAKPRSLMAGRNRTRRRSKTAAKANWNRNKRRNTMRLSTTAAANE